MIHRIFQANLCFYYLITFFLRSLVEDIFKLLTCLLFCKCCLSCHAALGSDSRVLNKLLANKFCYQKLRCAISWLIWVNAKSREHLWRTSTSKRECFYFVQYVYFFCVCMLVCLRAFWRDLLWVSVSPPAIWCEFTQ